VAAESQPTEESPRRLHRRLGGNPSGKKPMHFVVTIDNTGETFRCSDESSVLQGMEQLQCKGIPVGCRNGGCGVCKVQVTEGLYTKRKMSRGVISVDEEAGGCVLACKIYPQSNLRVEVVGKMARAVLAQKSMSFDFGFATATVINQPDEEK